MFLGGNYFHVFNEILVFFFLQKTRIYMYIYIYIVNSENLKIWFFSSGII